MHDSVLSALMPERGVKFNTALNVPFASPLFRPVCT